MDHIVTNDCLHISTIKTFTLDMSSFVARKRHPGFSRMQNVPYLKNTNGSKFSLVDAWYQST
jgi:hypothetical protein